MTKHTPRFHPLLTVTILLALIAGGYFPARASRDPALQTETQLILYPNIETAGVVANGGTLPRTAQLFYRESGETDWQGGHPLVRIDDGRLVGSLFGLAPATSYDVQVRVGAVEVSSVMTTQPEELSFTPSVILYVDDDAPAGGDGSAAAPFRTIQEGINRAGPGTQVLVADGIYREALTFPVSGIANQWIQVMAAGNGAILDGSRELRGSTWKAHPSRGRVWFTNAALFGYLARDEERFYHYDDLSGLLQGRGHGGVTIEEGWFYDANSSRLYVRSEENPANHRWRMSQLAHAFDVKAREWIWIEGFEIQFYGRCGVCTLNTSHLVIQRNKIHNMLLGIFVDWNGGEHQGNDTRIEYNEIYDPRVDEFPWQAIKGSYMEGSAIIVRGHIGAIVRGNHIHNFFNGIYTGTSGARDNPGVAFDVDVYNNYIHDVSDDALEPEGACVNHRFRNNIIDSSFVGVSLAPVTRGPAWVLRNVFSNYRSTAIKWAVNSYGVVFIYHNTGWTRAADISAMHLITPVRNSVMRNNVFQSTGYSFQESPTGSSGNDWDHNNWYTTRAAGMAHFKWEDKGYTSLAQLCKVTRLECNGSEDEPGFANPQAGNFTLLVSSPNIDRGVVIPGINDIFTGKAPDAGAYEFAFDPYPRVVSSLRADEDPTESALVDFTVTFSEEVSGVDRSDFRLVLSEGVSGASITDVRSTTPARYTVSVNTGSGNGTARLDVLDNDSIVDSVGQRLGGTGTGNGTFTAGEAYTVKKVIPDTLSVSFKSVGSYDGWVLESAENTSAGRAFDRSATTFNLGDDQRDRQYRSLLSFDTSSLPDGAVIVSAQVKVKRQSLVGADPFATHGSLVLEIRKGAFGNGTALQAADFSAVASPGTLRDPFAGLTSSWYAAQLSRANLALINNAGVTQFRLFFSKDDNDDRAADYLKFFSGNSMSGNQPELIVTYYVP